MLAHRKDLLLLATGLSLPTVSGTVNDKATTNNAPHYYLLYGNTPQEGMSGNSHWHHFWTRLLQDPTPHTGPPFLQLANCYLPDQTQTCKGSKTFRSVFIACCWTSALPNTFNLSSTFKFTSIWASGLAHILHLAYACLLSNVFKLRESKTNSK